MFPLLSQLMPFAILNAPPAIRRNHCSTPEELYFTTNTSFCELLLCCTSNVIVSLKTPVIKMFPEASVLTSKPRSVWRDEPFSAQSTLPAASYFTVKTSTEPLRLVSDCAPKVAVPANSPVTTTLPEASAAIPLPASAEGPPPMRNPEQISGRIVLGYKHILRAGRGNILRAKKSCAFVKAGHVAVSGCIRTRT